MPYGSGFTLYNLIIQTFLWGMKTTLGTIFRFAKGIIEGGGGGRKGFHPVKGVAQNI